MNAYLRGSQALETSAKGTERSPLRRGNVDGHRFLRVEMSEAKMQKSIARPATRRLPALLLPLYSALRSRSSFVLDKANGPPVEQRCMKKV